MHGFDRRATAIAVGVCLLVSSACGGHEGDDDPDGSTPSSASASATTTATSGTTYSSEAFVVPFSVTVDDALASPPDPDSTNLVSWAAATPDSDNAVRFLVPVEIYRPRSTAPEAPPADFVSFVQGLTADSAEVTTCPASPSAGSRRRS